MGNYFRPSVLLFLAILSFVGWILGLVVFKVYASAIHILLVLAIIWLDFHLVEAAKHKAKL